MIYREIDELNKSSMLHIYVTITYVIVLQETWFHNTSSLSVFEIFNYNIICICSNSSKHGCLFFIYTILLREVLNHLIITTTYMMHYSWRLFRLKNGNIYRPILL